jgi:uncharacterized paraquat-inducible protein A
MQLHYVLKTLLVVLLIGMMYFGAKAYKEAILFEKHTHALVVHQGIEEQANRRLEQLASNILGGLFETSEVDLAPLIKTQQESMGKAKAYTLYFMLLLLVLLFSYFVVSLRTFTIFGSLASMLTLVLGLVTPILMVTIHKDIEYLGDVVLSFESKGVMGSIFKLWESSDIVVALVILLFSVLIPVMKVLSLLFVSVFMESRFADKIVTFFKAIGKWSMVDVFVVAVFLVYLTSNNADVSRAEVEVGLYFFLAYVIVSMLVSLSADRMLKSIMKK